MMVRKMILEKTLSKILFFLSFTFFFIKKWFSFHNTQLKISFQGLVTKILFFQGPNFWHDNYLKVIKKLIITVRHISIWPMNHIPIKLFFNEIILFGNHFRMFSWKEKKKKGREGEEIWRKCRTVLYDGSDTVAFQETN